MCPFQPLNEALAENAAFGWRLIQKEDPAHGYHYYPEHATAGLWTAPTELARESYEKGGMLKVCFGDGCQYQLHLSG